MGGGTIMNFTASNRARVDKIVLVDAAGMPNKLPIMGRISNLPMIGEFMYGHKSNFIRKFILGNNFIHNKHIITETFFNQVTWFHKIKGSSEVMLYVTRKQFFDTLIEEIKTLGSMNVPTLIVWGKDETSIPLQIGQDLHSLLKGSQMEILDQAGHCSNIDQPEIFNRLVLDFLDQTS
jgi:pimeloyl-ACP methyl ester carboxylesterase